jgi:hypothetical protein
VCAANLLRGIAVCAVSLCMSLFLCASANANLITYGDYTGVNIKFENVSEDAAIPGHSAPLFGTPTVSGNTLMFSPQGFSAYSAGGMPDFVDSHLSMKISALGDQGIPTVNYEEYGDFSLLGTGTSHTQVTCAVPAWLTILKVGALSIDPIVVSGTIINTPGSGTYTLTGNPGTGVTWTSNVVFDVAGALQKAGVSGKATEVLLTLDNSLSAQSETSSISFIAKKGAFVDVDLEPVPEPASIVLLGVCAIGGLIGYKKRKAASRNS